MTELLVSIGATVGAAAALGLAAALVRLLHKVGAIEGVVCGEPADPIRGIPAVPSVGARLATLEAAVLRDQEARLSRLEARWDEHMATCAVASGTRSP